MYERNIRMHARAFYLCVLVCCIRVFICFKQFAGWFAANVIRALVTHLAYFSPSCGFYVRLSSSVFQFRWTNEYIKVGHRIKSDPSVCDSVLHCIVTESSCQVMGTKRKTKQQHAKHDHVKSILKQFS